MVYLPHTGTPRFLPPVRPSVTDPNGIYLTCLNEAVTSRDVNFGLLPLLYMG